MFHDNGRYGLRDLLKVDLAIAMVFFRKSTIIMLLVIPTLLLQLIVRNAQVQSLCSLVISVVFMLSLIFFSIGAFKFYHQLIFKSPEYMESVKGFPKLHLTLSKVIISSGWLLLLFLMMVLGIKANLSIGEGFLVDPFGSEALENPLNVLRQYFGEGLSGVVSFLILYFQGLTFLVTVYLGCTLSHLKSFQTYKTLAGIFFIIFITFAEKEILLFLKRWIVSSSGGIENILSMSFTSSLTILFGIEVLLMLVSVVIKIYFIKAMLDKNVFQLSIEGRG